MTRIIFGLMLTFGVTACNVDLVLPTENNGQNVDTVVDLNARTQNRVVISDQ